jgi:hypothetical protein
LRKYRRVNGQDALEGTITCFGCGLGSDDPVEVVR